MARLATVGADGTPHLVPVCFALVDTADGVGQRGTADGVGQRGTADGVGQRDTADGSTGDVVYSAVDHKPKRSARLRRLANIESTARACLLVDAYSEDWSRLWWVRLDGRGRIVDDPHEAASALGALREKYGQYAQRPPDGPVLAIDVERWVSWSA